MLAYTAARDLTEVFYNLFIILFYEIHFDRKILLVVSLRHQTIITISRCRLCFLLAIVDTNGESPQDIALLKLDYVIQRSITGSVLTFH